MRRGAGESREEVVAVAIDKDKSSQYALKWTVDHLITKGQSITLLHINNKPSSIPSPFGSFVSMHEVNEDVARTYKQQLDNQAKDLFLPFRCFCNRKDIKCNEVIVDDTDIPRTILNYVTSNSIETLVLGAPSRNGIVKRFKTTDVPSTVSKAAADFCTVYIISKGKISSVRSASSKIPASPARRPEASPSRLSSRAPMPIHPPPHRGLPYLHDEIEMRSPFTRGGRNSTNRSYELSPDSDISYVSSNRPSADHMSPDYDVLATPSHRISDLTTTSSSSSSQYDYSYNSTSSQTHSMDDVETEMKRLRMELKQTMDMYSTACKEALSAKKKAMDLHRWKIEEEQKLEEAKLSEEAALALAEKEKAKCKAAIEAAEAAQRIAELESQKRIHAEMKAANDRKNNSSNFSMHAEIRYRRYTIEEIESATEDFSESRKIGEGGYGPVFRGELDHTAVAIKVLRPDAAQGQSQFQQEVEVLSCIRHPNMVLLLGACPQFGCLVYEYMANGSLDDRLFRRGNSPVLPWRLRFRIAAEIGTALLFLHGTKPEPLVHRDLKPANILLDRNFVSKISDVGLARLVPPSVADSVTQYRMTATAGTFCYIDPEYQQTGMLGIKSDIYSLGVLFLQMVTAKPPMGLSHHVHRAIDRGTFTDMLDPAVPDWPLEETIQFAKLALKCAEMRRKDRPDLGKVILPELNRLREVAEESTPDIGHVSHQFPSSSSCSSSSQEVISDSQQPSGYENSSSTASS